ncbi:uncharacterized protein LOC107819124 [Nicotiana tabacum]|uniref:Uncharacterized protein LOC107819124 n=1 Tax=Nicotiana tabacum TaxID=4097 RepID=A0A1S4CI56_TOBAC|nr:PREDICTED: uncharacterized protein LOC107819124 [Nicotiana tabacum]
MAEDLSKGNRRDTGWKYNHLKDPNDTTRVTCNFCEKITTGGINRAKQHLIRNFGNAAKCAECPQEVREELKNYMEEKKIRKEVYTNEFFGLDEFDYQDDVGGEDEVHEIIHKKRGGGSSPSGSMFMESIDASSFVKTGEKLCELLDRYVERIGEHNVLQVNSYRKKKEETPCAAHCIDLMLEDIEKIPNIKKALQRAIALVGFIYGHSGVLNMMRDFTKNKELVKFGITQFATSFFDFATIALSKTNLRAMFTSDKWVISRWSKLPKGKSVAHTVLMATFWNQVVYILKIIGTLVKVL